MTEMLFRVDPYLARAEARVEGHTDEGGVILDRSVFYPTGGGQPGDSGRLAWPGGSMAIATAVTGPEGAIVLVPAEPQALPAPGTDLVQEIDWHRRFGHMRVHTALHLLSAVIPCPVTGGAISEGRGRLDFDMPEAPRTTDALEARLNAAIDADLPVREDWITEAELDANPDLVRTMSATPPRGAGRIRLVCIGEGGDRIDLQPCGGTHVARTAEIGRIRIGRVEKKGRRNRRVHLHLEV